MFSPLRQAVSAQLLSQGIGKECENKVWILNICHGGGGLEMVTVTSAYSEINRKGREWQPHRRMLEGWSGVPVAAAEPRSILSGVGAYDKRKDHLKPGFLNHFQALLLLGAWIVWHGFLPWWGGQSVVLNWHGVGHLEMARVVRVTGESDLGRELYFSPIAWPESWHSWIWAFETATLATEVCLRRQVWKLLHFLLIGWILSSCRGGQTLWTPVLNQGKPVPYRWSLCLCDFSAFHS